MPTLYGIWIWNPEYAHLNTKSCDPSFGYSHELESCLEAHSSQTAPRISQDNSIPTEKAQAKNADIQSRKENRKRGVR